MARATLPSPNPKFTRTRRSSTQLFRARFLINTRCDRLSGDQQAELASLFADHPDLAVAWELTQRFHSVFEADGLDAALDAVDELATAMDRTGAGLKPGVWSLVHWETQWRNYHTTGGWTTNCAEGLNTKIELLERRCYGFRDQANHYARILTDCPGHHHRNQPPTTLRTRPARQPDHALTR